MKEKKNNEHFNFNSEEFIKNVIVENFNNQEILEIMSNDYYFYHIESLISIYHDSLQYYLDNNEFDSLKDAIFSIEKLEVLLKDNYVYATDSIYVDDAYEGIDIDYFVDQYFDNYDNFYQIIEKCNDASYYFNSDTYEFE